MQPFTARGANLETVIGPRRVHFAPARYRLWSSIRALAPAGYWVAVWDPPVACSARDSGNSRTVRQSQIQTAHGVCFPPTFLWYLERAPLQCTSCRVQRPDSKHLLWSCGHRPFPLLGHERRTNANADPSTLQSACRLAFGQRIASHQFATCPVVVF